MRDFNSKMEGLCEMTHIPGVLCVACVQVLITIYWLGRKAQLDAFYKGPQLNFKAFEGLLGLALSKVRSPPPPLPVFNLDPFHRQVTLPFLNVGPRRDHKCVRERRLVPREGGGLCALQAQQSGGELARPANSSSKQRRCVFFWFWNCETAVTMNANCLYFCPLIVFFCSNSFLRCLFFKAKNKRQTRCARKQFQTESLD